VKFLVYYYLNLRCDIFVVFKPDYEANKSFEFKLGIHEKGEIINQK